MCDIQEKFRDAIFQFSSVIATTQRLLQASKMVGMPVIATTQLRQKLGPTCAELQLDMDTAGGVTTVAHVDKSAFSMWIPEVQTAFQSRGSGKRAVAIVGVEAHICVTQTALDLISEGHDVYIIADGVSSCNPEEVKIALTRLRSAGAIVTTSESFLYEVMGDSGSTSFKSMAKLVKSSSESTKNGLQSLCKL